MLRGRGRRASQDQPGRQDEVFVHVVLLACTQLTDEEAGSEGALLLHVLGHGGEVQGRSQFVVIDSHDRQVRWR